MNDWRKNSLPLIPQLWQPHAACIATVAGAAALGILASHMAGPMLAFPLTALVAKMAGEQIGRKWA
jgi:hypothetical protein